MSVRLQPVDYAQIDSLGVLQADWAFYRQPWVSTGDYPYVSEFDGGRVEATQRPTNISHGRPVAVLPAFDISGYVWIGENPSTSADEYQMQGEINYGCTGSSTMTGRILALVRWNAGTSKWEQIGRRAFTDTTLPTPGGAAITTTCVPWSFTLAQASLFQPGGLYYESAAAGELGISTEILPDFESSPFYGGPQTIFVDWMVLLPGDDDLPPLRQNQRDDLRQNQRTSRQLTVRQRGYL